jgi:carboxyl-terminal processing protease
MKKGLYFLLASIVLATALAFNTPNDRYFEIAKNLDIFATLFKEVNTYYVDEVNPSTIIKNGIDAMLESLDPYTNYIPEDDIEDYRTMTTGQYGGIGALVGKKNGQNIVLMPYKEYSAYKGGLRIGDEILKIGDIDIKDKSTQEISKLLKGQANTEVKLTVKRFGVDKPFEVHLKREKVTINNVPYFGMVEANIGYIKLSDFTTDAGQEVKDALNQLKLKGAKSIILDLRDNPGGLLSEAVNVSNVFIPKGLEVVSTKGKVTDWNKSYKALDQPADIEIPLVVITSSRSASAAEIVAGVIQDYDRGVLVGQKTFGKGLVQATRPLTYNAQLKVTTAKYYIPSGRCIQAIDYSIKNQDGSLAKVPDSLKVAFQTKNGRKVFDGGGVDPDVPVIKPNMAPIAASLYTKGLIFDYATEFYHTHTTIASPQSYKMTDADFQNFVKWLDGKDYDYTTKVEKSIEELIENAKKEKYYPDINEQIYSLKNKLNHNKEADLVNFKSEIKELLEQEIITRYYLQEGSIEASFDDDPDIRAAVDVLKNKTAYDKILTSRN